MATTPLILTSARVLINSVDYSADLQQVALNLSAESIDITTMGSGGAREHASGLTSGTVECTFVGDLSASGLDSVLFGLLGGASTTFEVAGTDAAVGTDAPAFQGSAILTEYNGPVSGGVGELNTHTVTFQVSGTITRATV